MKFPSTSAPLQWAAVQQAITAGSSAIDPVMAAKIVIEYAVPMAKLDPAKFDKDGSA